METFKKNLGNIATILTIFSFFITSIIFMLNIAKENTINNQQFLHNFYSIAEKFKSNSKKLEKLENDFSLHEKESTSIKLKINTNLTNINGLKDRVARLED